LADHGVGTDFSMVYAYHPEDSEDAWRLFDTSAPPLVNDLTQLAPGFGYWVRVTPGSLITVHCSCCGLWWKGEKKCQYSDSSL